MFLLTKYKTALALLLISGTVPVFAQKDQPVKGGADDRDFVVNEKWLKSKTPDGSYDKPDHFKNIPIPWSYIREADVLWKKRVWREIDTREKQNIAFRYEGDESSGGGMFVEILFDAVKRGYVKAYSPLTDDRFTTEMTKEEFLGKVATKYDTIKTVNPATDQEEIRVIKKDFRPQEVTTFRIKEEWIFDRNQGKMVVRIVGLAPVLDIYGDGGEFRAKQTMFWLKYDDYLRAILARYEVFNPLNDAMRYTWDEFFESRQFSSRITKVSNTLDQSYKELYGDDQRGKMESLYESQNMANEIFNKEHDMWVY